MPKLYKLEYGDLFQNEARALSHAHIFGVPRVIKYIEGARTTDDICLILEYVWLALQKLCSLHIWPVPTCIGHKVLLSCRLVRGKTLSTHMCSRPAHAQPGWEQQTLGVAVQLLDVSGLIAHIVCCTFAAVMMNSRLLLNVQTLKHLHTKANERLGNVLIVVLCRSCEGHACDWGSRLWSVYWQLLQCIMLA